VKGRMKYSSRLAFRSDRMEVFSSPHIHRSFHCPWLSVHPHPRDMPQPRDSTAPVYGGFWVRVAASIVDSILLALVIGPIVWKVFGPEYFSSQEIIHGPIDFLLTWITPAVAIVLFWIYKSATPGKMMFHLRIVDERTGGAPSPGQSIVRYLGYYVSVIPLGLGILWVAFDARKQGWHDKIAKTLVLKDATSTR
jgi:uncharacterized RDD family membrane protein YckC